MGLGKKQTLLEQAEGYVEAAIDQARDFVQETALPAVPTPGRRQPRW